MKDILLLIGKSSPCSGGSGFSVLLSGPLPHVRRHMTVNKMSLVRSLNKTFPSFDHQNETCSVMSVLFQFMYSFIN